MYQIAKANIAVNQLLPKMLAVILMFSARSANEDRIFWRPYAYLMGFHSQRPFRQITSASHMPCGVLGGALQ